MTKTNKTLAMIAVLACLAASLGSAQTTKSNGQATTSPAASSKEQARRNAVDRLERNFQLHARIVGGSNARRGEIPWQAGLIRVNEETLVDGFFCGGTIIHPQWVLTAAHCVKKPTLPSDIKVFTGNADLNQGCGTDRCNAVKKIIVHERYIPSRQKDDIALLLLEKPIQSGGTPISWVQPEEVSDALKAGTPARVSGWGRTEWKGKISPYLQVVDVPIASAADCKRSHPGLITDNMLCAGWKQGGKDACNGDSGGPLVVKVFSNTWALAGAVSWGVRCGAPSKYGVYTNVSNYTAWIRSHIGSSN